MKIVGRVDLRNSIVHYKIKYPKIIIFALSISTMLPYIKPGFGNSFPIILPETISYLISLICITTSALYIGINKKYLLNEIANNNVKYIIFFFYIGALFLSYEVKFIMGIGELNIESFARFLSFIIVGPIAFIIIPHLLNNQIYFNYWIKTIIHLSVIPSLIAFLGVIGVNPFTSWIIKDEMMAFIGLPSTASIFFEPNIFASVCMLGIVMTIYKIMESHKIYKIYYFLLFCILISGVFFSWSRAVWMNVFIVIFIAIFLKFKLITRLILLALIPVSISLLLIVSHFIPEIGDALVLGDALTGRNELWSIGMRAFANSPFIGYGTGHDDLHAILAAEGSKHITTHQIFIDQLLMSGLFVGLLYVFVFVMSFVNLYIEPFHNKKINTLFWMLLVSIFIFIQFSPHNIGGATFFAFQMTIIFGMANLKNKKI